jgi:HNH endonuclease
VPANVYQPAGRCIYCGATQPPLSKEHIIPLSLGGNLIIPKASCKVCAKIINSEIETPIAHHEWGPFRTKRTFPTRRKKKRKTHIMIQGLDGVQRPIPIRHHSTPVPMYKFGKARILEGLPPGLGDDQRWTIVMLSSKEEEIAMQERFPEWNRVHTFRAMPHRFARLIAKIGHGYATAEVGIGSFKALTTDVILGHSDDFYYYVGGNWNIDPAISSGNHITDICFQFTSSHTAWVVVHIRLFSAAETPNYHVVVGEIDLTNADHLQAFEKHRLNGKLALTRSS